MLQEKIEIRGAKDLSEVNEAIQLMSNVSRGDSFVAHDWLGNVGAKYPNFQNEHIRIALYDGKIISALRIITDVIRIGEARLKMGGIVWASTARYFRNKGIASRVIQNAVNYMKANLYHVSMLFGVPNFYRRFGFATTIPEFYTDIPTCNLLTSIKPTQYKVRKMRPADIVLLRKIHDNNDEDISCSIIRTQAHFAVKWKLWETGRTVMDMNGKILGYFLQRIKQSDTLFVQEMGSTNEEASKVVLHAVGKLAEKEKLGKIQFASPPSHPIIRFLNSYCPIRKTHYKRSEGGMMAIINEEETLECMLPEWEEQLRQKSLLNQEDETTIIISGVPYCIRYRKGSISVIKKSGRNKISIDKEELAKLISGYICMEDILSKKRFFISSNAKDFLLSIFPKRFPYVWQMDRF